MPSETRSDAPYCISFAPVPSPSEKSRPRSVIFERTSAMATSWMRRFAQKPLIFALQYHADQDLDELRAFWGRTLAIDGSTIRLQRKSNSGQLAGRSWRSEHGVLTVTINDTLLRARLQAWIDSVFAGWV